MDFDAISLHRICLGGEGRGEGKIKVAFYQGLIQAGFGDCAYVRAFFRVELFVEMVKQLQVLHSGSAWKFCFVY